VHLSYCRLWSTRQAVLGIHFAGIDKLAVDKEAPNINKIISLQETVVLEMKFLKSYPRKSAQCLKIIAVEQSSLFVPILDDLYKNEWCLVVYAQKDATTEAILGVSIPADRALIWNDNLVKVSELSGGRKPSNKKYGSANGWEGKVNGNLNLFRFARAGDWVIVGLASNKFNVFEDVAQKIQKRNFPQRFVPIIGVR
jgi:hypothetical protein